VIAANPRIAHPTWQSVWFYWSHRGFNLYQPVTYSIWQGLAKVSALPTPDPAGLQLNPFVFHLAGLLFHVMTAVAVYGILLLTVRSAAAAVVGALVFAIHPLVTEPVAFIGSMNTPIAAALALSAVWLYLSRPASGATGRLLLATALYGLALLAKPTTVTIPLFAGCLEIVALRRPIRRAVVCILPWVLLTVPVVVGTQLIQTGATPSTPLWAHLRIAGDSAAFYLVKVIWPIPLAVDYGRSPQWVLSHSITAFSCLVPAALLLLAGWFRKRWPVISLNLFLYLMMLLPNSGLVAFDYQRISNVADRYAYLALVPVALLLAAILARVHKLALRRIAISLAILVLAWLALLTNLQLTHWQNGIALFSHAVEVNPQSWYCYQALAQAELNADDPGSALVNATHSIQLNPANAQFQSAVAEQDGEKIPPPGYAPAWAEAAQGHVTRGNALDRLNRLDEAAKEFTIAVRLNPGNIIAMTDLAIVLGRNGHEAEAQSWLNRVRKINPSFAPALKAVRPIH
jgi:tetratricopeptide (TPR) repeat protein